MQTVTKINPHLSSVKAPPILASKPMWLMWRFEHIDGEPKPRKVPYYINGLKRHGVQGRLEDRQNLVTFEAAKAAAIKRGFDGIGHACLDGDFTVIDFDRCAVGGKLDAAIESLAANTYAEYSPSGEGIHLYVEGNLHGTNSKSVASRDAYGIELFATKGFVTFTGNALEIVDMLGTTDTIAGPSTELKNLVSLRFGTYDATLTDVGAQDPLGLPEETIREALTVLDPDMGHEEWLRVGMAIHHETGGEGFALWDAWSAQGSKYPGDDMLLGRWESFGRNPTKQVTIKSLIKMANENGARISVNSVSLEEFENLAAATPPTDDLESLPELPNTPDTSKMRFPVIPAVQFAVSKAWGYIVKGVLPQAALAVLYGEPGSGKSFVMLDMALAIAQGKPWRGHRTSQGRVVYLVAEGASGFRNRLIAYMAFHSIDLATIPLDIIDATPNFLQKADAVDVCKAILASGPRPSIVVVDTFAQVTAGANENSSDDMGKALAHCKGIHQALGCLVTLVHHSGKDSSKGARGWSGLNGAADAVLEVVRSPWGRLLRTTKQKDGADFKEWGFDLEIVNIGEDSDGDVMTSCVVIEAGIPVKATPERKLGTNEKALIDTFTEFCLVQTVGIEQSELVASAIEKLPKPEGRDTRAQHLKRALTKLVNEENPYFFAEEDGTLTAL